MDRKAFIKSCRRAGYKYVKIATFLGVTRQRVEQLLRPEKVRARQKVKKYKLESQPCEYPECKEIKTEAHHPDYNYPLMVHWVCKKHHEEWHTKEKREIKKIKKCGSCGKEFKYYYKTQRFCAYCQKKRDVKLAKINYATNPVRRLKHAILVKKWKESHKERNKELVARAAKKYQAKNRELINARQRERTKRKKNVDLST